MGTLPSSPLLTGESVEALSRLNRDDIGTQVDDGKGARRRCVRCRWNGWGSWWSVKFRSFFGRVVYKPLCKRCMNVYVNHYRGREREVTWLP